ncbi:uncharacterized protein MELLADRAFT_62772 [Melampsora larici-populina 98AG31]|uniref:Uncharacterized protein n=1 Tax=Melampsora larici-populina (strain 98AG31 / pathotype 3-4-7) TaxID=747676 RepID=F4RK70_MELLP|nr:uncharacterized protein MELLADRAFT_62772 [Melampsora larici-populina 98AG31]EGG07235.1 hypothetical protein MELLADRAFT_62772 [Melampsora larici-populina 98AG31]
MPDSPYIGKTYRRVPPHDNLPLPSPGLGVQVGLSCPSCPPSNNRSLVYFFGGEDYIKVKCETVPKHYYRTFKLNQLNHELALINAGHKYPIPFDASAHGPPVNLQGAVVPAKPSKKTNAATTSTTTHPKRGPPSIECARSAEGPTSGKHKKWGHIGCTLQYCKSCCVAYGTPGSCYVHRPKPATTTAALAGQATTPPARNHLAHPAELPTTAPAHHHMSPPAELPNAKRPRLIPQCSQSIHRVGTILDDDGSLVLRRARQSQADALMRASKPSANEHKEPRTPVISHIFPTWPLATLDECPSLLRQAKEAAGALWDGSLLIWDEEIKNWREVPVTLEHRYIQTCRNLVICVPSQRVALTQELQDVLEGLGMGKPVVPKYPKVSSGTTATIVKKESNINQALAYQTSSQNIYGSYLDPICFLSDSDSDLDLNSNSHSETPPNRLSPQPSSSSAGQQQGHPSTPESEIISPLASDEQELCHIDRHHTCFGQIDVKPPLNNNIEGGPVSTTLLREWPGEDVLFSSVLDWYQSAPRRGTRIPQWIVFFGNTHELEVPTAYHYFAWVKKTGYDRMMNWLKSWPDVGEINQHNVTVSRARRNFQAEFNEVCRLKAPVVSAARKRGIKGPRGK